MIEKLTSHNAVPRSCTGKEKENPGDWDETPHTAKPCGKETRLQRIISIINAKYATNNFSFDK